MDTKLNNAINKFLSTDCTITEISKEFKIKSNIISEELRNKGYIIRGGMRSKQVINLKNAIDEYILNLDNEPSLTTIAKKYNITRGCLSKNLKDMGYEIINHQNKLRFDNSVFDIIDTEEKAYWLGFIYADGSISSQKENQKKNYNFELSLQYSDVEHLQKFARFIKLDYVPTSYNSTCNGKTHKRCRITFRNKHFWERLNDLGCTPNKSLTLTFPDNNTFINQNLITHFIRGYFDGDGCITYSNHNHTKMEIQFLGTDDFLTGIQNYLHTSLITKYVNNNCITKSLNYHGMSGLKVLDILYKNSKIYLERKYQRYLEYCRLYEKSYELLEDKIGEDCDVNTELTSEIAKGSEVMLSVEIE